MADSKQEQEREAAPVKSANEVIWRPRSSDRHNVLLRPGEVAVIPPEIAKAIVAIQAKVSPLEKSAENAHFKNTYVPLSEVMREALRLLSEHKLGISQWPLTRDDRTFLITILMHESGSSIQGEQELLMSRKDSQGQGSSMTYARRYGIMAILGLVGDDDDDGNKAANRQTKPTPEQLSEIRQLCIDLKFPRDQMEARVASLRTEDQATVAIANLHKIVSEKAKRIKDTAEATPVFTGDRDQVVPIKTPTKEIDPIEHLRVQLEKLPIPPKRVRELIRNVTGKPFLKNCNEEEQFKLAEKLDDILSGKEKLPADWFDPDIAPAEETA
ncbi:ERF family protein [Rhodococcus pyridinivorans]|uniref:ERF family protein n=1 Tax=Rhodococcus pyridinivorans TaxID=103816 RepID=UPI00280A75A9|nr:ERF family protein [Rhodococcus pyridinivorans]WMM74436.1 ERF family protein [Rhodococcus pyridinivorans]